MIHFNQNKYTILIRIFKKKSRESNSSVMRILKNLPSSLNPPKAAIVIRIPNVHYSFGKR